jgi:hypothetical protein
MIDDYTASESFKRVLEEAGSVVLVLEDTTSMMFFKENLINLRYWLNQLEVNLSVYSLSPSGDDGVQLKTLPKDPLSFSGKTCDGLPPLAAGNNKSLIFLCTDCTSPNWYNGGYDMILRSWAEDHVLTIIPAFPQRLWGTSKNPI